MRKVTQKMIVAAGSISRREMLIAKKANQEYGKAKAGIFQLMKNIHREIEQTAKFQAMRFLDSVGVEKTETENPAPSVRKGWTWGKVGKTAKQGAAIAFHSIGTMEPDLAMENSLGARLTAAN